MTPPGSFSWYNLRIAGFDEADGFEVVALADAGNMFAGRLFEGVGRQFTPMTGARDFRGKLPS